MVFNRLQAFFNPEQFQGWGKTRNYFEGWYFKLVNEDATYAFAIIPGIAMDPTGSQHAFIQVLDGIKETSQYHKFEASQFKPSSGKFEVSIGPNYFSESKIEIRLPNLSGSLQFAGNVPWPKPFYSPGIMGPYAFVPFMECYHGIVSMDHKIQGQLNLDNIKIDFDNGRGYIEKDWGRSFPSAYTWMQSNHFSKPGVSFKCSVANIPWLRSSFVGFIAGLWYDNQLIRFTTYNFSKLLKSQLSGNQVFIDLENPKYSLQVIANRTRSTELASPIHGAMQGKIEESMTAALHLKLKDKRSGEIIFEDFGKNAGLEVAGNTSEILIG